MNNSGVVSIPRILVGTLACGEAELEACKQAVGEQVNVHVEHLLIENLPELEAHSRLLTEWNKRRPQFDLFVKIDGDTVLETPEALSTIWALFQKDPDLTAVQTGLLDYFGNKMIAGLNCFRPDVSFSIPEDPLFCDRIDEIGHRSTLKPTDTLDIYPIARHCVNPHAKQAFHFGYRRWMKGQAGIVKDCLDAWLELGGDGRLWALLGARAAFYTPIPDASYDNQDFLDIFEHVDKKFTAKRLTTNHVVSDINAMLLGSFQVRLKRVLSNPKLIFGL